MLPATLLEASLFIWVAMVNGFDWSTILIGVVTGLGCLAVVARLLFPKYWRPCET
jgi:multisubunit Na+/H+ antiporter MnhE subunit